MLEAFPGAAKVADDEGYLPLHLALDCARPNPVIARMLLDHYPESAFHKSKDGLLPIHCIISSLNPVIEVIELLLQIFPDSTESMAVDVIPVDMGRRVGREALDPTISSHRPRTRLYRHVIQRCIEYRQACCCSA